MAAEVLLAVRAVAWCMAAVAERLLVSAIPPALLVAPVHLTTSELPCFAAALYTMSEEGGAGREVTDM